MNLQIQNEKLEGQEVTTLKNSAILLSLLKRAGI